MNYKKTLNILNGVDEEWKKKDFIILH
jgi:hypothetical protein